MFERFTEKARRSIFFARYEASQYGSRIIETEHLLLGVLREDRAFALKLLREKGGEPSIRAEIESQITRGERISTSVDMPLSPESNRVLNMAVEEAERLGSKNIGTEHLFVAILREQNCLAAKILSERGLTLERAREQMNRHSAQPEAKDAMEATETKATEEIISVHRLSEAWSTGNAEEFASLFSSDGQFVDPQGTLWIGPERIASAANLIFSAPGWAKSEVKIEDVHLVGSSAVMVNLAWGVGEKIEPANPGAVRMTVILLHKREGWRVARVQATGILPRSQSAAG